MSKMDALRAMREARYAESQARANGAGTSATPKPATRRPTAGKPTSKAASKPTGSPAGEETATAADALCGHRNMSGRTCTREQGHTAKSHRYS